MTESKTDEFRKGEGGIKSNENKGFLKENERFKKKKKVGWEDYLPS